MCNYVPGGFGEKKGKKIKSLFFEEEELTTANPPLAAAEDWLWANIHAHPPLFYLFIYLFLKIFFFRKISPELTTASPLFLLRKTGPELTSMSIFLYFICGMPTTAWCAKRCHVRTRDPNRRTPGPRRGMCALNHCATGPAPQVSVIPSYLDSQLLFWQPYNLFLT